MTALRYGSVSLEVIRTKEVSRRPILSTDGTTYLYTEWVFDFTCIMNPRATSYVAKNLANPVQQYGQIAVDTDASLRHYLAQPRRPLEVTVGNKQILKSPKLGYPCDANNGPIVEAVHVLPTHGLERTFEVHIRIKTWVNDCDNGSPLLSHRWKQWVDIDEDQFATIHTDGEAVFRTDILQKFGYYPDVYRAELVPPIPKNFRRQHVLCSQNSEGNGINYHIVDQEHAFNLGANCPATRIEAYQTAGYRERGILGAAGDAALGAFNNFSLANLGLSSVAAAASAAASALPKYHVSVMCRAWGDRTSSRAILMSLAMGVVVSRSGPLTIRANGMEVTQDLAGKFVEAKVDVSWGPEQALVPGNWNDTFVFGPDPVPNTWGALLGSFNSDETIKMGSMVLSQNQGVGNPGWRATGSRGTWLENIVAQALTGPCAVPEKHPLYGISSAPGLR